MNRLSNKIREDIAHEVVINTLANLKDNITAEKCSLSEDRIAMLRFTLEKEIRVALLSAESTEPLAKIEFNIFAD